MIIGRYNEVVRLTNKEITGLSFGTQKSGHTNEVVVRRVLLHYIIMVYNLIVVVQLVISIIFICALLTSHAKMFTRIPVS